MNSLPDSPRAPRRKTLHEELTQTLRELIVHGQLQPGVKVPEKDLCETYAVSRTPLREALKVLASEGLIELLPNRGARVSQITQEDLEELFPVMGALEALAGELACQNITDRELDDLRRHHDDMVAFYRAGDLDSYYAVNQRIHEGILEAARNPTLTAHYRALSARVQRARYVANTTPERWAQAVEEHGRIMTHLAARDGQGLADTLRQHLQNKLAAVSQALARRTAAAPD